MVFRIGTDGDEQVSASGAFEGQNSDTLIGLGGNDILFGFGGGDFMWGDSEDAGDDGNGLTLASDGNDILIGGTGPDILYGNGGDDFLVSSNPEGTQDFSSLEFLYGGSGNDVLLAGKGNDQLYGGDGVDVALFESGFINFLILDGFGNWNLQTADGTDTLNRVEFIRLLETRKGLDYSRSVGADSENGQNITEREQIQQFLADPEENPFGYQFLPLFNDFSNTVNFDEIAQPGVLIGGEFPSDPTVSSYQRDALDEFSDNITATFGEDNDFHNILLYAGAGNDVVKLPDIVSATAIGWEFTEEFTFYAGEGNDVVFGGDGDDFISLGNRDSSDKINEQGSAFSDGDDFVFGGAGNDSFILFGDEEAAVLSLPGTDPAVSFDAFGPQSFLQDLFNLPSPFGADFIDGDGGFDKVSLSGSFGDFENNIFYLGDNKFSIYVSKSEFNAGNRFASLEAVEGLEFSENFSIQGVEANTVALYPKWGASPTLGTSSGTVHYNIDYSGVGAFALSQLPDLIDQALKDWESTGANINLVAHHDPSTWVTGNDVQFLTVTFPDIKGTGSALLPLYETFDIAEDQSVDAQVVGNISQRKIFDGLFVKFDLPTFETRLLNPDQALDGLITNKDFIKGVILHEIGHSLGLWHMDKNQNTPSIMLQSKWRLGPDSVLPLPTASIEQHDINYIKLLYGENTSSSGKVVKDYLSGATVFADENGNLLLDGTETTVTTDAAGAYTIGTADVPLVAFGGTDVATLLDFGGVLRSLPNGAGNLTPLTTLAAFINDIGTTEALLEVQDLESMGLGTTDPIVDALSGSPSLLADGAKIYSSVSILSNWLSGFLGVDLYNATISVYEEIADLYLAVPSDQQVDLSDVATVTLILEALATTLTEPVPSSTIDALARVIADVSGEIDNGVGSEAGVELLQVIAATQQVAQGEASLAARDLGAAILTASELEDEFSGLGLQAKISNALLNLGDLDGPENENNPVFTSAGPFQPEEKQTSAGIVTAFDPDGDAVEYSIAGGDDAAFFDIDATTGAITFKSAPDFETPQDNNNDNTYLVTVEASDGNTPASTAVAITVTDVVELNLPPVAVADDGAGFGTDEDTAFTTASVLLNDSDPEGDSFSVTGFDTAGTLGLVTDNGDGTFGYDPDGAFEGLGAGESGSDSFEYEITDSAGNKNTATVTIAISGVDEENLAPVAVDDDGAGFGTDEDTAFTTASVLLNDSDPEGDSFSVTGLDTTGTLGLVTDNGDGTFGYDPDGAFEGLAAGESGSDSFEYEITDSAGNKNTATVTIAISGVDEENLAPVAVDDDGAGFGTDEDTAFTTASVLLNDSDPEGDSFSVTGLDTTGTLGLVTDNGDGTFGYDPDGAFEGLAAGESGSDSFEYEITDSAGNKNTATVTIAISGVDEENLAPVAVDDDGAGFGTDEDTAFTTASVLLNDSDPEGDSFSVTGLDTTGTLGLVTDNGDGTFGYDPDGAFEGLAAGESGSDSFEYEITDSAGNKNTATVTIAISGVDEENLAPVAVDDDGAGFGTDEDTAFTTASVLLNDSDPEGDSFSVTGLDTTGTLGLVTDNGDGTFGYDPDGAFEGLAAGESGSDSFEYEITDSAGNKNTATVTIAISGVDEENLAPVAVDDDGAGFGTDEDTAFTTASVLLNDSDPEGDSFSVTGLDTTGTLGLVTDNGDGTFGYDPDGAFEGLAAGESGSDSFEYEITDSAGNKNTATVTIAISGVDDGPSLNPVSGTSDSDNLVGTDEADAIRSLAGSYDKMFGGEGADEFIFGAETSNGVRERDVILDFEVGIDAIVLEEGASVASIRQTSSQVVVFMEGDLDAIYVRGDGVTEDNITIVTDDVFDFV